MYAFCIHNRERRLSLTVCMCVCVCVCACERVCVRRVCYCTTWQLVAVLRSLALGGSRRTVVSWWRHHRSYNVTIPRLSDCTIQSEVDRFGYNDDKETDSIEMHRRRRFAWRGCRWMHDSIPRASWLSRIGLPFSRPCRPISHIGTHCVWSDHIELSLYGDQRVLSAYWLVISSCGNCCQWRVCSRFRTLSL